MLALPFIFCGPLGFIYKAYRGTCLDCGESPEITQENSFLPSFLAEHDIREDLKWQKGSDSGVMSACGVNCIGSATILIDPSFFKGNGFELNQFNSNFSLKHEIAHIKHNDLIFSTIIPAVCSLVAAIFSLQILPIFSCMGVTYSVAVISSIVIKRYQEGRADDFALRTSSVAEILGARRFFKICQMQRGDRLSLDFDHPSYESRIKKIEKELISRKNVMDQETAARLEQDMRKLDDESIRLKQTRTLEVVSKETVKNAAPQTLSKKRIFMLLTMPPLSFQVLCHKTFQVLKLSA